MVTGSGNPAVRDELADVLTMRGGAARDALVNFSANPASGIMYREVPPREAVAYYKLQAPLQEQEQPEAMKTDRSGYTRYPADATKGSISLVERIDVG